MQGLIKWRESFLAAVQAGQCGTMPPGAPSAAALRRRTTQREDPKTPQDPQWPLPMGKRSPGAFAPPAFGFPTEASSAEGLGSGEMPVLQRGQLLLCPAWKENAALPGTEIPVVKC